MEQYPIQTMRDQVYQKLRDEICSGTYPAGAWLQENELTEHFGVSRSPVREALHRLVSEGLLIEIRNKGVFVREFTVRDIDEIFDLRVMLENYSIRNARTHRTAACIQGLFDILADMELAYKEDDLESYTQLDDELHNEIVRLGENSLVNSTYYRVRSMNRQFRILSLTSKKRFDESIGEHREIVNALAMGDEETAAAVNTRHLQLARDCIKEQLNRRAAER